METLVSFCKKLGKTFAVITAGFLLLLNVACSSGNEVGARPHNPPVQMGGQNNPHKAGGDGYSEYQMSTDPTVTKRDRASLEFSQLIASNRTSDEGMAPRQIGDTMRDPMKEAKQIPEQPQKVIDRSDPNARILEKSARTFKEAGKHLTGATEQSIEQLGTVQQDRNR